jgi:hypothetical protein
MKPSEYWQRQCFLTHSVDQSREQFTGEDYDSVPNVVFGADVGHSEGWWPVFGFPEPKPEKPANFANLPVLRIGPNRRRVGPRLKTTALCRRPGTLSPAEAQ